MQALTAFKDFVGLFGSAGITVDEALYGRFERYAELLLEWNSRINLTAITDPEGIAVKHFFDSVYPFTLLPPAEGAQLIDVGTGAGFPSVPLKLVRGDIKLTLLDSLNKRLNFLGEVSEELRLGAELIHGRAEETARFMKDGNPLRESFDAATARAVAELRELCEYCMPFVKVDGRFYALKGSNGMHELNDSKNAVKQLGGEVEFVKEYELPNGDERVLIVIRKTSRTPQKYPRNSGRMKKAPL